MNARATGLEIAALSTFLKAFTSTSGTGWVYFGSPLGALLTDTTAPADASTVTIGNKTYTFKTTLSTAPAVEGEVLINTTAAAAQLNLIRAINHTGSAGTDYTAAAAHTQVSADPAVSTLRVIIRPLDNSIAGSTIALAASTSPNSHMTWDATTLTGGPIACAQIRFRNDSTQTLEFGHAAVGSSTPSGATFKLPTTFSWTFRGLKDSRQLLVRRADVTGTVLELLSAEAEAN